MPWSLGPGVGYLYLSVALGQWDHKRGFSRVHHLNPVLVPPVSDHALRLGEWHEVPVPVNRYLTVFRGLACLDYPGGQIAGQFLQVRSLLTESFPGDLVGGAVDTVVCRVVKPIPGLHVQVVDICPLEAVEEALLNVLDPRLDLPLRFRVTYPARPGSKPCAQGEVHEVLVEPHHSSDPLGNNRLGVIEQNNFGYAAHVLKSPGQRRQKRGHVETHYEFHVHQP